MTSSSSLYGTPPNQDVSSTNSTSLYGGADTPIPDSSGNLVVRGDLLVLSGNILTTATTGNIFPANATTINLGLAATAINIGAGTGTTSINNNLAVAGDLTIAGIFTAPDAEFGNITIAVADDQTITTTAGELRIGSATGIVKLAGVTSLYTDTTGTFNLLNQPATVNAFLNASTLTIGDPAGTTTIRNDVVVQGGVTAIGADFGNIQIAVAENNTISTTSGALKLSSTTGLVGLEGVDTLYTDAATFNLLNSPTSVFAFRNATNLLIGEDLTGTTTVANDLQVNGDQITLAQDTTIVYDEANDRLNRPNIRSTTGNSSGLRVSAPNATTSAVANVTAFSTNDDLNGKFINISARGAVTNDLRIQTGKYTAGVLGASGTVVSFIDNITAYATVNPAGPTNALDLTTKAYVDAQVDSNTTYTIDASTATGGANFNLAGSDATTDTIKFASGTGITVSRTNANTITITNSAPDTNTTYTQNASAVTGGANLNLVGSDATTDSVKFASGTGITVTRTDADTITITNSAPDTNTTYTQNISSTTGGANLNLVGSDATTDTVKFANGTGVTVSYTDASTATVAIGQAVGPADAVTFGSVTTGTINANGGVSFVNTAPMGGTYATVNPFGPINGTDLTTVSYVNSILPVVVTYNIDASSATGGANLNLTGSNATTDTVKIASGTGVTVVQTDANTITASIGQAVGTGDSVTFADVTLDALVNLNTATLTTSTTAADQVADSFVKATYRTCKYVIQITSGSAYQAVEALVIHNGTTAYVNTYSDVRTGANLTSINAVVNGANVELQVTPVNAVTTYKISKTLITV